MTYIDDYPFAVVVVVWNWMEVVLAGILRILVDSFLLVSTELGQFPEMKIKQFRYLSRFLINRTYTNKYKLFPFKCELMVNMINI